ncbi:hypothetical protein LX32DRAFT_294844 [Colletotrichum zoysiae]|uniref:Uncharacterized protein n=2 Tax=Colletotrichum zoysiae TaxID=1216348 RepID=A0AAD9H1L1_9PEZI|nr:hypothetical protein LX32DRAFT_294844 [Colletotrichum zoysiae]
MQDIHMNPEHYEDVLRPWQECPEEIHPDGIFNRQWCRWRDFRKWQNDNRGRDDEDGGYTGYVEWRKDRIRRDYGRKSGAKYLAAIEADSSCLRSDWDERQSLRERHRRLYREHNCNGFDDYAAAVKRRLARHGFIQQFKLDEDPKKQDKLTTWIEYLSYECWWLDKYTSDIERLEPHHDKGWQE